MDIIRVLIIEDNPADMRLIREELAALTQPSFKICFADRLASGLRQLQTEQIEVVLLDLFLPDSTGIGTLKRVLGHCPNVPVIVLTGLDYEKLGTEAMRQGAQDYLVKGQTGGKLLARAVLFAMERKRIEDALRDSEEKFRNFFEGHSAAMLVLNVDTGAVLKANAAAAQFYGWSVEELRLYFVK